MSWWRRKAELKPTDSNAYTRGLHDGMVGKEVWENPFCQALDGPGDGLAWHAGWCRGVQWVRHMGRNDPIRASSNAPQ